MEKIRRTKIVDVLKCRDFGSMVNVKGWVRTRRGSKQVSFIALNDFFDVYRILKFHQLDLDMLRQAIEATFANRNTQLEENHLLFRDEFANDDRRNSYWKAFLKRIKWKEELDFKDVWKYITDNLKPYYDNMLPEA